MTGETLWPLSYRYRWWAKVQLEMLFCVPQTQTYLANLGAVHTRVSGRSQTDLSQNRSKCERLPEANWNRSQIRLLAYTVVKYSLSFIVTETHIITDAHRNLLFSLGIISNNAKSKNMQVEFVRFCSLYSLILCRENMMCLDEGQ